MVRANSTSTSHLLHFRRAGLWCPRKTFWPINKSVISLHNTGVHCCTRETDSFYLQCKHRLSVNRILFCRVLFSPSLSSSWPSTFYIYRHELFLNRRFSAASLKPPQSSELCGSAGETCRSWVLCCVSDPANVLGSNSDLFSEQQGYIMHAIYY